MPGRSVARGVAGQSFASPTIARSRGGSQRCAPAMRARRAPASARRNRCGRGKIVASKRRSHQSKCRPRIGLLDMRPRLVHQMHVVHAGWTGRHAGQARQAAIDVLDLDLARRAVLLQHVLDEVDAPARRIQLVAQQHIGRAGRGAEPAMHAGAQDLVGFRDIRIGELREGRSWSAWRGDTAYFKCMRANTREPAKPHSRTNRRRARCALQMREFLLDIVEHDGGLAIARDHEQVAVAAVRLTEAAAPS